MSCHTIWSLKSRKSWHVAKLVNKLLFTAIRRQQLKFHLHPAADAGAITISLLESTIYMVISWRLYAGVKAYWFNWLRFQQHWRIWLRSWLTTRYAQFLLWLHLTYPDMTTSWSRSPLRRLRYSGDNVQTLHKLSKCSRWRQQSVIVCLWLNDCWNPQVRCAVHIISFTEVVGCILPSQLSQFVELHLLLPKPIHALLYRFIDCAYHPSGFVNLAQLSLPTHIIILIFPILPIIGTYKITQTVSNGNQHLLNRLLRLLGRQSCNFSMRYIVLLLLNRCLCVFTLLSCPNCFSFNIILNLFLLVFIAYEVCFSSFLCRKLLFVSHAVQGPKGSDSLCLEAALAFIRWLTSLGWPCCWFAVCASVKWRKVHFRTIDHCISRGPCC